MSEPIPQAYKWLEDALRPHCDKVICHIADFGCSLAIGCQWGQRARIRKVMLVEHAYRPGCGLNEMIAAGLKSKREAIRDLLFVAPML